MKFLLSGRCRKTLEGKQLWEWQKMVALSLQAEKERHMTEACDAPFNDHEQENWVNLRLLGVAESDSSLIYFNRQNALLRNKIIFNLLLFYAVITSSHVISAPQEIVSSLRRFWVHIASLVVPKQENCPIIATWICPDKRDLWVCLNLFSSLGWSSQVKIYPLKWKVMWTIVTEQWAPHPAQAFTSVIRGHCLLQDPAWETQEGHSLGTGWKLSLKPLPVLSYQNGNG